MNRNLARARALAYAEAASTNLTAWKESQDDTKVLPQTRVAYRELLGHHAALSRTWSAVAALYPEEEP